MRIWKNLSFAVLVLSFVAAHQRNVLAIGVFLDVVSERGCTVDEDNTGFTATCTDECDTANPPEYEEYWFDIWAACIDWCEHPDLGYGAAVPGCMYHSVDLWEQTNSCYVACNCNCLPG